MSATIGWLGAVLLLAAAGRADYQVEVDGNRYRVRVEGDQVTVINKGLFVLWTPEERDRKRAAAQKATGCQLTDDLYLPDNRLKGRLSCPTGAESPAKP
jgi:hypothetical protein